MQLRIKPLRRRRVLQSIPLEQRAVNSAPETTGSIAQRPAPAPSQIESRPLPQASYQQQPPYQPQPQYPAAAALSAGAAGALSVVLSAELGAAADTACDFNNNRNASYQPASAPAPDYTGSVRTPPQAQQAPGRVRLRRQFVQLAMGRRHRRHRRARARRSTRLSNRYGVPAAAIAQSNGLAAECADLSGPAHRHPAIQLRGTPARAPAPAPTRRRLRPRTRATVNTTSHRTAPVPAAQGQAHIVKPGETLIGLSRRYNKPIAEIAAANNLQPYHKVQAGDRIVIPGARARRRGAATAQRQPQPQVQQPRYAAAQPRRRRPRAWSTPATEKPPVEETNSADAECRRCRIPLAGARPHHRRLRPEADRPAE